MRLGLSTFCYTWAVGVPGYPVAQPLSAVEMITRTHALGLRLVQFGDNLDLRLLSEAELADVADLASRLGVAIEVGTRGIGNQLATYADLAVRFGAPFVRVVIDSADDHPSPAEAVARIAAYEAIYRERGLVLAIENHDRFTTADLIGMLDELGDWVRICLDTVNSLGALEPPTVVVEALAPYAINLHLKDFVIRRHPHAMGFEVVGTPAGQGVLDIGWLVDRTAAFPAIRTAALELWTPPESDLEATIAKEAAWVERSLGYLRTVPGLVLS